MLPHTLWLTPLRGVSARRRANSFDRIGAYLWRQLCASSGGKTLNVPSKSSANEQSVFQNSLASGFWWPLRWVGERFGWPSEPFAHPSKPFARSGGSFARSGGSFARSGGSFARLGEPSVQPGEREGRSGYNSRRQCLSSGSMRLDEGSKGAGRSRLSAQQLEIMKCELQLSTIF